jgi:hypothetical protein
MRRWGVDYFILLGGCIFPLCRAVTSGEPNSNSFVSSVSSEAYSFSSDGGELDSFISLAALVVAARRNRALVAAMDTQLEPLAQPKSVLELPESSYGQYYASLIHQQNMLQDSVRTLGARAHASVIINLAFH